MGGSASEQGGGVGVGGAAQEITRMEAGLLQAQATASGEQVPSPSEGGVVTTQVDLQLLLGFDFPQLHPLTWRLDFLRQDQAGPSTAAEASGPTGPGITECIAKPGITEDMKAASGGRARCESRQGVGAFGWCKAAQERNHCGTSGPTGEQGGRLHSGVDADPGALLQGKPSQGQGKAALGDIPVSTARSLGGGPVQDQVQEAAALMLHPPHHGAARACSGTPVHLASAVPTLPRAPLESRKGLSGELDRATSGGLGGRGSATSGQLHEEGAREQLHTHANRGSPIGSPITLPSA